MRIRIDNDRCQGHQMCAIVAPELFGSDDDGYGTVLVPGDLTPDQQADAERAIAACPERAVLRED